MSWRDQIQANILRGLPAGKVEYRFLSFGGDIDLKAFVRAALPFVHDAAWQRERFGPNLRARGAGTRVEMSEPALNLAFTRQGIELVTGPGTYRADDERRAGLDSEIRLARTSDAFAPRNGTPPELGWLRPSGRGITNAMYRRLDILGELPVPGIPSTWDRAWLDRPIHVMLWASGPVEVNERDVTAALIESVTAGFARQVIGELSITGQRSPRGVDHFGFIDGVGQPAIEGEHGPDECIGRGAREPWGWRGLKAGEIVVGERDEGGELRFLQPAAILNHATFLVFRQIEMRPERFDGWLAEQSARTGVPPDAIAGWLMGRHRRKDGNEGTSLMVDGAEDDPDFIYGYDPHGLRCPLGAHVRRANPRDGLGSNGLRVNRHRIVRRGMPYAHKVVTLPDGRTTATRGLAFVALQARIEDQFEFVQARWLNTGPTLHVGNDPDPFAGVPSADSGEARFVHQGSPTALLPLPGWGVDGDPETTFTTVRGGEYFVMPSLPGLYNLVTYQR